MPNEENTEAGRVTLESVLASENLHAAWLKVKANDGAAGVDRRDIATTKTHLRENWKTIAAKLRTGDYQPGAVRAARPPASLPAMGSVKRGSGFKRVFGGCVERWRRRYGDPRERPSEARSLFPPSPRGGERRGFGGSAPIKPVRGKVAGRSTGDHGGDRVLMFRWFFGALPLHFFRRSSFSPTGKLLSVSGALKPRLHADLFESVKRNERAQTIHRRFGPKGGDERVPFQSVSGDEVRV